jgi:hypothetical protein
MCISAMDASLVLRLVAEQVPRWSQLTVRPVDGDRVRLPTPEVVGVGVPACEYPLAYTLRRWIDGVPLTSSVPHYRAPLAGDPASLPARLRRTDPAGPPPWLRSGWHGTRPSSGIRTCGRPMRRWVGGSTVRRTSRRGRAGWAGRNGRH